MASPASDLEAKKFLTEPGKASVYVIRQGGRGWLAPIFVTVDRDFTGTLDPATYQLLSLGSGAHTLELSAEGNGALQEFNTEADKTYFFLTYSVPFSNKPIRVEPLNEQDGRQWVAKTKRAAVVRSETEQLIKK